MNRRQLSLVMTLLVLGVVACSKGGPARTKGGEITKAGSVSVFKMAPGDCLSPPTKLPDPDKPELEKIEVLPCGQEHTHELFATVDFTDSDVYPGPTKLGGFADGACLDQFEPYVGVPYVDSSLRFSYLFPSLRSWNDGKDRTVLCLIVATDKKLTASVRGAAI